MNEKQKAMILVGMISIADLLCSMTSCSQSTNDDTPAAVKDTFSSITVTQATDIYENDNSDYVKSCFSVAAHYTVSGDKSVSDFTVSLDTSTTGTASATITYGTMTKTVDVAVKESKVSISDSYDKFYVGDTLTNKFSITYDGGRTATINSVTIGGGTTIPDSSSGTILVSYTLPTKTTSASEKTYEKTISIIQNTLSSIAVTQATDIYENDNSDYVKSCFSVAAHYTVSGDKSVSDFTVSLDTSTTGTASATITYGTMTKTVDVAVKESKVSISDSYDKFYVGDTLTNKFSITYDGSRTATINSVTIDGGTTIPDSSSGTILVSYTLPTKTTSASEKTYEKAISIIQKITITITNNAGKRIKITGETSGTSVTIEPGQQAEGTFDIGEKLLIKNITKNDKIPTADYETNNITSENTSMSIELANDDGDTFKISM